MQIIVYEDKITQSLKTIINQKDTRMVNRGGGGGVKKIKTDYKRRT